MVALYQSKEIPSVMIHRVLFQPKPIKFLYINSEILSIIFFHCDMNALTLKLDMGISVKIMKSYRKHLHLAIVYGSLVLHALKNYETR